MILRSMRKGFFSAIFLALLVLGAFSLVLSDWTGTVRGGIGRTDVAKVDGTPIKISGFNTRVNNILRSQNINPSTAYEAGIINAILNNQIYDMLLERESESLGIRVENRIVANQIKALIAPLKKDGISDHDALKQFLTMQGMNEKELVETIRKDVMVRILKAIVQTSNYAPSPLVRDVLSFKRETRSVDYIFLPDSAVTLTASPSDKDLEDYYQAISGDFMVPEKRSMTLALLDTKTIAPPTITDDMVKTAYESNLNDYRLDETVTIEQKVLATKDEATKIADALRKEKSTDTKGFQSPATFTQEALPTELGEAVFSGKVGDIVGPIETPLGFHVVNITARAPSSVQPFDSVKEAIRKNLKDEKKTDAVFDVTSAIEDALANGERFEDIQKQFSLKLVSLPTMTPLNTKRPKDLPETIKDFSPIIAKAFTLGEGESTLLMESGSQNILVSVRADSITPTAPKPFAEARQDVLKRWTTEQQQKANIAAAQQLVEDLNTGKVKLTDKKFKTIQSLSRDGTQKDVADDVVDRFMAIDKPADVASPFILAVSSQKDGIYVGQVTNVTLGKVGGIDKSDKIEMRQIIGAELANTATTIYLNALENKYKVTINQDLLKRTYGARTEE